MAAMFFLSACMIQACSRKKSEEPTCNFVTNSVSQRVSWDNDVPVLMMIHESVPQEYWETIEKAAEEWNKTLGRDVLKISIKGVTDPAVAEKDSYSVIYWMDQWEEENTREQARTSIYWVGQKIVEADIKINAAKFRFAAYDSEVTLRDVDLYSLMVHEFGHALGLAHVNLFESVMNPELAKGVERRTISQLDFNSARCEY